MALTLADLTTEEHFNYVLVGAACSADWRLTWPPLFNSYFNRLKFEATTNAMFRKVSNLRVWGLGRLTRFCNPVYYHMVRPNFVICLWHTLSLKNIHTILSQLFCKQVVHNRETHIL